MCGGPSQPDPWEAEGYESEEAWQQDQELQRARSEALFTAQMKSLEQQRIYQEETMRRQQELLDLQREEFETQQARLAEEQAERDAEEAAQEARTQRRREIASGGRGATIFTGGAGDEEDPEVLKKRLGG